MNMKMRLTSWPTTAFGVLAAAAVALQGSLGCERSVMEIGIWGPAVAMAILGAMMKGGAERKEENK